MMPMTVLLIEDDAENLAICRTILEQSGFEVLQAADGESGLHAARERTPTLICLDLSIPERDGLQVVRLLKSDPVTSSIPVLALTEGERPADRIRARDAGCDGYLPKLAAMEKRVPQS